MKKEFVTYEQALALKELGFDEPCLGYWKSKNWLIQEKTRTDGYTHADQECSVPLYQQAFRWFREKYNFEYQIIKSANGNYSVVIHLNTQEYLDKISTQPHACIEEVTDCYSYEEAELECLIKLIEIIKNKQD
jgi:hypothetical protein